jgi:aspartyl-tRNA(Asn)/glutamyl-tRNA(Gln) amidotransferase subunit B
LAQIADHEVVVGLEVHVQLNRLQSKLFCGCKADYLGAPANSNVCPICLGLPGSLPVLNSQALNQALMVAHALNCRIFTRFNFVRKNYFYPDMTKNFQISQYDRAGGVPIATDGWLNLSTENDRKIRIRRIQIEEDPGRLEHPTGLGSSPYVLVDYNRAGVGLLEIVTEPDMRSPKDARTLIQKLRSILEHLGVCDASKEGAIRADANISVDNGNRVEVKNITSYKEVEKALEYEIARQTKILDAGGQVARETRHWIETKGVSIMSRSKEMEQDYRYFPEADIPPFELPEEKIQEILANIPELPDERIKRFIGVYGLNNYDASVLVLDKALADFFEATVKLYNKPKVVSNWIQVELMRQLNERKIDISGLPIKPEYLADMLSMVDSGEISGKTAKKVVMEMAATGMDPKRIVDKLGLRKIADPVVIKGLVQEVFAENPSAVADAKIDVEAINFLVGQVMKKSRGRADPALTNKIVREELSVMS